MKIGFSFSVLLIILFTVSMQLPTVQGQSITKKDSLLLSSFWNDFRNAIDQQDKNKLATLFQFPFYCSQCTDYVAANDPNSVTVLVTQRLLLDSVYQLFYALPTLNSRNQDLWKSDFVFMRSGYDDKGLPKNEFVFSYVLIPPSKTWEGSQGFVYVKKIKGKYRIIGMDTVP
jgi:hypothetical protein